MKTNFYIELNDVKVLENDLITKAKDIWKAEGNKVKDLTSLDIYYKPDERRCFYVFNEEINGDFEV